MQLIPWKRTPRLWEGESSPEGAIQRFREEADRLFERFLSRPFDWQEEDLLPAIGEVMPELDVSEDDKSVTIQVEVPGIDAKDIDVSVSGDVLTISGEKRESTEQREKNRYHCERRFGSFSRRMQLPAGVDADSVAAELSNGVLTVRAKKLANARTRHVTVKGEKSEKTSK